MSHTKNYIQGIVEYLGYKSKINKKCINGVIDYLGYTGEMNKAVVFKYSRELMALREKIDKARNRSRRVNGSKRNTDLYNCHTLICDGDIAEASKFFRSKKLNKYACLKWPKKPRKR